LKVALLVEPLSKEALYQSRNMGHVYRFACPQKFHDLLEMWLESTVGDGCICRTRIHLLNALTAACPVQLDLLREISSAISTTQGYPMQVQGLPSHEDSGKTLGLSLFCEWKPDQFPEQELDIVFLVSTKERDVYGERIPLAIEQNP